MENIQKLKIIRTKLLETIVAMQEVQFHITHLDTFNEILKMVEDVEAALRGDIPDSKKNNTSESYPITEESEKQKKK